MRDKRGWGCSVMTHREACRNILLIIRSYKNSRPASGADVIAQRQVCPRGSCMMPECRCLGPGSEDPRPGRVTGCPGTQRLSKD
eukprot:676628-Hanusia_phi.AAC.2